MADTNSGAPSGPGAGGPGPRQFGDRPSYGDRPSFGDRPQGDRPNFGDRPQGDRPSFGDRPSYGDRPQGDRPSYGDRPGGGFGGGRPSGPGGPGGRPRGRGGKDRYVPRRKVCQFCAEKLPYVDYKDVGRLRRFLSERGKIEPRRKTGTCARHQRALTVALKRARHVALLPFVGLTSR